MGTIVTHGLASAPQLDQERRGTRDQSIRQRRRGTYFFGMKAHIGWTCTWTGHTVVCTAPDAYVTQRCVLLVRNLGFGKPVSGCGTTARAQGRDVTLHDSHDPGTRRVWAQCIDSFDEKFEARNQRRSKVEIRFVSQMPIRVSQVAHVGWPRT